MLLIFYFIYKAFWIRLYYYTFEVIIILSKEMKKLTKMVFIYEFDFSLKKLT